VLFTALLILILNKDFESGTSGILQLASNKADSIGGQQEENCFFLRDGDDGRRQKLPGHNDKRSMNINHK